MLSSQPKSINPEPCIEVIDYGGGNIGSLCRCLERLNNGDGVSYRRVTLGKELSGNAPVILPGVGAFGALMNSLAERDFIKPLQALKESSTPLLGICVGLQVLFERSEESADVPGLGLLKGNIVKFKPAPGIKIPQIGWNCLRQVPMELDTTASNNDWPESGYVYFVNSYVAEPEEPSVTLYTSDYNGTFCAAVHHNNLTAFQFHPEKSGPLGQDLIQRWSHQVLDSNHHPHETNHAV